MTTILLQRHGVREAETLEQDETLLQKTDGGSEEGPGPDL